MSLNELIKGTLTNEPLDDNLRMLKDDVVFDAKPNFYEGEVQARVHLIWSEKHEKWLSYVSGKTSPAHFGGAHITDSFRTGYYNLNESASRKILKAYGLDEGKISTKEVIGISPFELRKLN